MIRRHGAMVAFGVLHCAGSGFGQTYFISLFVPPLLVAHDLSQSAFGSFYGGATLVSSLLLPFLGRGLDVWPAGRYAAVVIIGLAVGCAGLGLASNLPLLLLSLLVMRHCGQGLMGHVAGTTVARHFHASRGSALSLTSTGYPLAETCLPLMVTLAIEKVGFRAALLSCGAALLVAVLPLSQWLYAIRGAPEREHSDSTTAERDSRSWTSAEVLRSPSAWALLPLYTAHAFLLTGLFFHQLALAEGKGLTPRVLAGSFVAFGISRGASSFLVGLLIDRFGSRAVMSACLVPLAAGLGLFMGRSEPWVATVYLAGAGLSMGASGAARTAYLAERFGLRHLGGIKSTFGMLAVLSSAAAPPLFGFHLDRGGSVHTLLAACLVYCGGATLLGLWGFRQLSRSRASQ